MKKPKKCCAPGEYACQVPMAINGRRQDIDFCVADIVAALNAANIRTVASCCGHGMQRATIALEDGRGIFVELGFDPSGKKCHSEHCEIITSGAPLCTCGVDNRET